MQSNVDTNSLAIDGKSLNRLKYSKDDSPESIREVAKQFEGVLLNMMLKSMRDTVPQDGFGDSEQSKMFTGMLDQQLSTQLSQKGLGLTDVLVKQLSKLKPSTNTQPLDTTKLPLRMNNAPVNSVNTQIQSENMTHLNRISGKVRSAYQLTEPVHIAESENTPQSDDVWTINELPDLLDETTSNLQPVMFPAGKIRDVAKNISDKTQQFIQSMLPHAQNASMQSGIPAHYMIGQAALESGWGKHEIKMADGRSSHNLFGIKADDHWTGKVVNSYTTEYINGVKQIKVEKFRAYDSYSDAFKDYANLISQNPRYKQAINSTHNPVAYANALQRAGYATDPNYSKKLTQVIQRIDG